MKLLSNALRTSLIAAGAIAIGSAAALAESYKIDSDGMHARIGFETPHLGYSWLVGRFDKFTGEFTVDEADPSKAAISVTIDTTSINTNHEKRDEHLRSPDFFDAASHGTATFESTSVKVTGDKTAEVTGNLTIRGVTKEVTLQAEHIGAGDDPWGGYRRGFRATGEIVPADFGMPHAIAKQPVKLTLDVEGIRQ